MGGDMVLGPMTLITKDGDKDTVHARDRGASVYVASVGDAQNSKQQEVDANPASQKRSLLELDKKAAGGRTYGAATNF